MTTAGLLGLLAACPRPPLPPPTPVTELRCPDPTSCTIQNGTGVYFAEDGFAGLGPTDLMITQFINGSTLSFQSRYLDPATKLWRLTSAGQILAEYLGKRYRVVSLHETRTVPTWTLEDLTTQAQLSVTDGALSQLRLMLAVENGTHDTQFVLDFEGPASSSAEHAKNSESTYGMSWTDVIAKGAPTAYCHTPPSPAAPAPASTAQWPPDSVVFQEGIDVDPVTGTVTLAPSHVTMSCYFGAPATVYRWGYDYRAGDTSYFASGIHMKRASYCGDAAFYTVAGTEIHIADNIPVQNEPGGVIEAWWTPTGASCLDYPDGMRHGDIASRKGFNGSCGTRVLPRCPTPPPAPSSTRYLVDRSH
jgi:hypothetical protein